MGGLYCSNTCNTFLSMYIHKICVQMPSSPIHTYTYIHKHTRTHTYYCIHVHMYVSVYIFKGACVGRSNRKLCYISHNYSIGNASAVLYCHIHSTVNKKLKWHLQVNLAEISLLTEAFA